MRRRDILSVLAGSTFLRPAYGQARKRAVIAVLGAATTAQAMNSGIVGGFREGLRELGYAEGDNVEIVYRFAEGHAERFASLSAELLALHPDVVAAPGDIAASAVRSLTWTVPIVSAALVDPVGAGLARTEARPGGNVTGIRATIPGMTAKLVELATEIVPGAIRVGVIYMRGAPEAPLIGEELRKGGKALLLEIVTAEITSPEDYAGAFAELSRGRVAVAIVPGRDSFPVRGRIVPLAAAARIPTLYTAREFVEIGGLASYGVNSLEMGRRSAALVDKILKGAKPAEIPIEFPTKLELAINGKTAKSLDLTIPPTVLVRADRVIE